MPTNPRPSLRPDLLTHQLDGQLMVYDRTDDQIHLLDGTTATVFAMLQQGAASVAIESALNAEKSVAPGAELLALALDELARARLIESEPRRPALVTGRREVLQKLAGAGAALLIPAIVTLTPNRAYAQGSQLGFGATCSRNTECASGCCGKNSTGSCVTNTCVISGPCDCSNQG